LAVTPEGSGGFAGIVRRVGLFVIGRLEFVEIVGGALIVFERL